MKFVFWVCVVALLVLHQDYWQWSDGTLDFGFLPRGMTYHAILSIVAAVFWLVATIVWWPKNLAQSTQSAQETES